MAPIQLKMDPWTVTNGDDTETEKDIDTPVSGAPTPDGSENIALVFNDDFTPFAKLPDSSEYLASLEKKLENVQRGSSKENNLSSTSVIRSLEETRESYMVQLLSDTMNQAGEADAMDELKVNPILKKLAPEKQAIALEELVHLVKADQLALLLDADDPKEEQSEAPELLASSSEKLDESLPEQ